MVSIARIIKTRGIRGELVAEVLTDFPSRFEHLEEVCLKGPEGTFSEVLERHWFQKGRIILKFIGRDRPHEAEELIGCEIRIPESERVQLPAGTYYDSDLIGCEVFDHQGLLGVVESILKVGGGTVNLVVLTEANREFMIPLVSEFVTSVSTDSKRIEVRIPSELLELSIDRSQKRS